VQPDFMLFKNNPYVENKRQTRTAGCPDLVVEIWSDGNSKNDRAFLQNLYATSDITEHWYIEQDSNEVICYIGHEKIKNQSLTEMLETRGGLKFDLRYLAV
jgi:Uma2 family endonuclease